MKSLEGRSPVPSDRFQQDFKLIGVLEGHSLSFTPDSGEPNGYSWVDIDGVTSFAIEPGTGTTSTVLPLGDDDFEEYSFVHMESFTLFGVTSSSMFVSSNGYITFNAGRTDFTSSIGELFSIPHVAAYFTDLSPSAGGTVTVDEFDDKASVTFDDVPLFGSATPNDFQIILGTDGTVEFVYVVLDPELGVVGLTSGVGIPPLPRQVDFYAPNPEICDDGIDNSGDGFADCADGVCFGMPPCDHEFSCADSVDSDLDGLTDCDDPDCGAEIFCLPEIDCDDDTDNDVDGRIDCADDDCFGVPPGCVTETLCNDWQDNDLDSSFDCDDPDCEAVPICIPETDCYDNSDNDLDGWIDCQDSDCFGEPPSCTSENFCRDGWDNDADGLRDCDDSDCEIDPVCIPEVECGDGEDNEGDGRTDCEDDDCFGVPPCDTETLCTDSQDNDADGLWDCEDPDCGDDPVCLPESTCDDRIDNDRDGWTDCQDSDCFGIPPCDVESICGDLRDNDADGVLDCEDEDCAEDPFCVPEVDCGDGIDNEGDGWTDCYDGDCFGVPPCDVETICGDLRDNDADGVVDCEDEDCADDPYCVPEVICGDGIDNEGDGWTDCQDNDCFGVAPACSTEAICNDWMDNDSDGLVDCGDPDCEIIAACAPARGIWEEFKGPGDDVDLEGLTLGFNPSLTEAMSYSWTVEASTSFQVIPGTGTTSTVLTLDDDDSSEYVLGHVAGFDFYGVSYTSLFIGSNGYITFGMGVSYFSVVEAQCFELPTILGLWTDLNPSLGRTITVDESADWVAVTFEGVPRYGDETLSPNDFQMILYSTNDIEIVYLNLSFDGVSAAVGIGEGGRRVGPAETNFVP